MGSKLEVILRRYATGGMKSAPIHPANAAALALIRLTNAAAQLVLRTQVRRKES